MANTAKKTTKTKTTKNTKAKDDNKNLIIGVCAAVVVIVIVIIIAVFAFGKKGLDDNYFKSDNTKYVLTVESDEIDSDDKNAAYTPIKTHIVYTYEGDNITGMTTYGEYADNTAAKKAFDAMKDAGEDMTNASVDGKYIVVIGSAESYEGMTASDVKSYIDFLESLNDLKLDDNGNIEDTIDTTEENN